MSALPPKADIRADVIDVGYVPLATKVRRKKQRLIRSLHRLARAASGAL
jgi:hypothetical protein